MPLLISEFKSSPDETNFRFAVYVIVKIRGVCSRGNKKHNRVVCQLRLFISFAHPLADLPSVRRIAEDCPPLPSTEAVRLFRE